MTSVQRVTQLVGAIFGHKFFVAGPYGTNRKIRYHIKYEKDDETSCLIIDVESNFSKLHIDSLAKCGPTHDLRSGTMLLNMVDALVKLIPECKTITLQDASYVKRCSYDIDLASLTILLTGISWYNHLGYKQPSYESEKAHNHRIINMHINDAVKELLASSEFMDGPDYPKFVKHKQKLDASLKLVNADLTVSEYIKIVYDKIKPYPEHQCIEYKNRNAKLAAHVINAFGDLLHYSRGVFIKNVVHGKHIPPFIDPSTMSAFAFEPEDIFNCGECGRLLRGDDLPPWNAEPKGVKYYTTRYEGEHEELICHDCAARAAATKTATSAKSPKAVSPKAVSPKAASPKAVSPKAVSPKAVSPKAATSAKSPKARSAPGGGAITRNPTRRTRRKNSRK
jgi:hypothetical protein